MAIPAISKPISTLHLAWAAGFLEGEGSFVAGPEAAPCVSAAQVQLEPLQRLAEMFGGKITSRKTNGFSDKSIFVWRLSARRSIEVMMTLYLFMSPRRKEQIERSITKWRSGRLLKSHHWNMCGRGHLLTEDNVFLVDGKYRKCRQCRKDAKRRMRARRRNNASTPIPRL
jgi:hypothetical protein